MRKILLLSAALTAMLAGPALAQRGEHGRGGGGERGGPPPAAAPAQPPAQAPAAPQGRGGVAQQSRQHDQERHEQFERNRAQFQGNNRPDFNRDGRPDFNRGGGGRPDFNRGGGGRPDFNRGGGGRPDFRGGDRFRPGGHADWGRYHRAFNAPHRFHWRGPAYRRPPGWYYRRWSFGDFLPSIFWSNDYWIGDYGYYGLMPPPPGTVWVRYGDDALLIDRYTGEVIQVEYGVFF